MAEATSSVPVKSEGKAERQVAQAWRPFESLRREVDRLFEDFDRDLWRFPVGSLFAGPAARRERALAAVPAVDVAEKDKTFEVTVELPGMDEKNVEVKLVNGSLSIRGEKQEEKEEKKKDYHLRERYFGSFERRFALPEGVDPDKIEASFGKGVLTVTLPKKPEAVKPEKKIQVKAG